MSDGAWVGRTVCIPVCLHVWPRVCLRTVDLTINLIQGEQCFTFGFNGNKQLRAQRLSSLFTTLQLNLISSRDLSLITLRVKERGKKCLEIVS